MKQCCLHSANKHAWETLYGGAAGGAKTHGLLWDAYLNSIKYPGFRSIILRRTYPELEKSIIRESRKYFTPTMGRYFERKREWRIYTTTEPSTIEFGHCKNESDVYRYQSTQYDAMYIDELTHFTEFQFTYLITRVRPTKPGFKTFVKCASNPGNIGHGWVRRRYNLLDKRYFFQVIEVKDGPDKPPQTRLFIPSFVTDNYYIVQNAPDYIQRLENSPFKKLLL